MLHRHLARTIAALALVTLGGAASSPAVLGPPWISIEYPVNPYDSDARGAYLMVHAFHHQTPTGLPVEGRAEGLVAGARKTVTLEFRATSKSGVFIATLGKRSIAFPTSPGVDDTLHGAGWRLGEKQGVKRPFASRRRVDVAGIEDAGELLAVISLDHRAFVSEVLARPGFEEAGKIVRATTVNSAVVVVRRDDAASVTPAAR